MLRLINKIIKKLLLKCGIVYYRSRNMPNAILFFYVKRSVLKQNNSLSSTGENMLEVYDTEKKIVEQEHVLCDIRKKGFDIYDTQETIFKQKRVLSDIRKKGFDIYNTQKNILKQKNVLHAIREKGFELYNIHTNIFKQKELIEAINAGGYEVFLKKNSHHYVPDYYGPSAHKRLDIRTIEGFYAFADEVIQQGRALLYYDRLYMIFQVLKYIRRAFVNKAAMNFAEVGVYKGGTSGFICKVAEDIGLNSITLHSFDTFTGHASVDIDKNIDNAEIHTPSFFGDIEFSDIQNYLSQFKQIVIHQGRFQDTSSEVDDMEFHLVHLDVDLYEPTIFGLNFFHERLPEKGIMIIDDYGVNSCPGVVRAVDEFLAKNKNYFVLNPLTEQLIFIKQSNVN